MKLLIDVDKDYYEIIKYNVEHGQEYKPFEIIANGIPYENNGGLISREALLNEIMNAQEKLKSDNDTIWERNRGYFKGLAWANRLIIDAPTIEPQGEWIFEKANEEHTDGYICSNCKRSFHTKVPYFSEFNFCPNCGADMRGGAE